jgi:hypothetical protein
MLDETDADLKAGLHYYQELGKRLIRIAVIRRGGCSEGAFIRDRDASSHSGSMDIPGNPTKATECL